MRKSIFYKITWFLVIILMTANVYADTSQTTLDRVVAEVLEKNPELKFFEAEVDTAKGLRRTAGQWANPEANGSLGQKRVWNEENELTGKGRTEEIGITQTFEWPGRLGLRRAIADRDIELAELGLQRFRVLLEGRAKIAAYKLLAAQMNEAATLEVAEHFRALREVLGQRSPAGLTPLLETRVIEAIELNMQRKATEASLAAKAALLELNQLRGAKVNDVLSLSKSELKFNPLEKEQDELIKLAQANDFTVREHAIELERQRLQVGLSENERLPAISVSPSISKEQAGDRERVIAAAVSVPLPIWNHNQGNIATAKARRTQAETSLYIAQREAERLTIEAMATYHAKFKDMARWQSDSIQHFREASELADRHYRLGAVPVSIYVELQSQYLEATAGLYSTKIEALEAATQLELLTGIRLSLTNENAGEGRK